MGPLATQALPVLATRAARVLPDRRLVSSPDGAFAPRRVAESFSPDPVGMAGRRPPRHGPGLCQGPGRELQARRNALCNTELRLCPRHCPWPGIAFRAVLEIGYPQLVPKPGNNRKKVVDRRPHNAYSSDRYRGCVSDMEGLLLKNIERR